MALVVIILILIIIWMLFGTRISYWMQRKLMETMEDRVRRAMRMPTGKEERKRNREARKAERKNEGRFHHPDEKRSDRNPYHSRPNSILPKEYAEDVEFTEYKEFHSSTTLDETLTTKNGEKVTFRIEEQVSDAEYIDIKTRPRKE